MSKYINIFCSQFEYETMMIFFARNHQKAKFESFVKYFDWIEKQAAADEKIKENRTEDCDTGKESSVDDAVNAVKFSRKVFSGKQWLTIEDWLECGAQLCPLEIKHEGRIERSRDNVVQTIFASTRLGGNLLTDGWSQECLQFTLFPELIAILLYVESLEDNEVMFVEDLRQFHRIVIDSNKKIYLEPLEKTRKVYHNLSVAISYDFRCFCVTQVSVCLMDPENYSSYPISQFEEDNILRELNKCLLAFRQNTTAPILSANNVRCDRRPNSSQPLNSVRESKDKEKPACIQRRLGSILFERYF